MEPNRLCENCGSNELVHDTRKGETICSVCGLVVDRHISESPEWRAYDPHEVQQRVRSEPEDAIWGSTTEIGRINSRDLRISSERREALRRQKTLDRKTSPADQRALQMAYLELRRLSSQLSLSSEIAKMALMKYYKRARDIGLLKGRTIEAMSAACLYLSARDEGITKSLRAIVSVSNVELNELSASVRLIIERLGIKPKRTNFAVECHRLGTLLNMTPQTCSEAVKIIEKAQQAGLTIGKNPASVVSAAIYIAGNRTGERRTQDQIAKIANTTAVTIRNRFKEIVAKLNLDVPVKRGAAARPFYVKDPASFAKKLREKKDSETLIKKKTIELNLEDEEFEEIELNEN